MLIKKQFTIQSLLHLSKLTTKTMSYLLSELLAGLCIFESIDTEVKYLPKSVLQTNLLSIQKHYHGKPCPVDVGVELSMDKPRLRKCSIKGTQEAQFDQRLLNIFQNICNNPALRRTLEHIANTSLTLNKCSAQQS